MRPPDRRRASRIAWLAALAGVACSPASKPADVGLTGCRQDGDCTGPQRCPSGGPCACVAATCLPTLAWPDSFAVEVLAGYTLPTPIEMLSPKAATATTPATFAIDTPVKVAVTFTYPTISPAPPVAMTTLALRPLIPGRPDVPVETLSEAGRTAGWTLPAGAAGRAATLTITPRSPDDQTSPIRVLPTTVDTTMKVDLGNDPLVSITGRVLSAAGDVLPSNLSARAFVGGAARSNSAAVTDGTFVLLISAASAAADAGGVVVEVGPAGAAPSDPSFVFGARSFTGNSDLGTIKLPAYTPPQPYSVRAFGDDPGNPPIASARVRMRTVLPDPDPQQAAMGIATLIVDAITDATGGASLGLLPGVPTARSYEIAIVPPPGSPYATSCFVQSVGAGGTQAAPAALPDRVLPRRPVFSGRVMDDQGRVVPNVLVTATPTSTPVPGCTQTGAVAASVRTGDAGFSLPLDPGTYQLDYDPPPGSAAPRLTELAVTIAADAQRDVMLPPGFVVDAVVATRDGPVGNATVRIFERRCGPSEDCFGPNRTAPWLRGQIQTGSDGRLRAVVGPPQPSPAP